jgi:hypothetical protein
MLQRYTFKTWCIVLVFFVMGVSIPLGLTVIRSSIQKTTTDIVHKQAPILIALGESILQTSNTTPFSKVAAPADTGDTRTALRITVLDAKSQVLFDSQFKGLSAHEDRPEIKKALSGDIGEARRFSKTSKDELYYVAFPIKTENGVIGVSRIAIPSQTLKSVEVQVIREKTPLFLSFLLGFFTLVIGIYFVNKRNMQEVVSALREKNPEKLSYDSLGTPQTEIKEACMALTEKLATELSQKESALEEKKAILDHLTERVLLVAQNDEILHLNPAAKHLFSVSQNHSLYVNQACRNSLFLDTVRETLKNRVVTNKRILFHSPSGPMYLAVTGVPVLLNKQIHALMLLATPTYTWMPTYTKLVQLWIEKKTKAPQTESWLQLLNDTHTKLCKGIVSLQEIQAETIANTAKKHALEIEMKTAIKGTYLLEPTFLFTIFIALKLCYYHTQISLSETNQTLVIDCQLGSDDSDTKTQPLDEQTRKFIDELVIYFQAAIQHTPTGFQLTVTER